jgi:hypothetical protein
MALLSYMFLRYRFRNRRSAKEFLEKCPKWKPGKINNREAD